MTMFLDAAKAQVQAALLHHVLEDTDASLLHLLNAEIQPAVLRIVERLTRDEWASYLDYIQSIAASDDISAIRVKLADNLDNSDPARLYPGGDRIACEKYMPARAILEAALAEAERDSRC
jgi:(p)ppGpp synthase/HD superfamily hydrolase